MDKGKLLSELKIDRREPESASRAPLLAGIGAGVLVIAGVLWWIFGRSPAFVVEAATAVPPSSEGASAAAVLQATGYVTARRQATVSAQITGTLREVLIEEGERVEQGQVLARLENTAQLASLGQAQAQLKAAQAVTVQFEAQLAQARRDLVRNEDLVNRKLVSQQALETARTHVESLAAQVDAQRKQADLARAGLQGAQVQLDYTTVRAPFSGVIIAKAAQAGEIISPISAGGGFTRTGVGTIVDMDSLEIEVDVNESYLNRVQAKQSAQAVLDAYPDWTIPAQVIAIVPTADRSKATVKVRVGLGQKDPRILPDMGVRVSFLEEAQAGSDGKPKVPSGVLVPASAIVQREGQSLVFLIDDDRARGQAVAAGQNYGDLRLVQGLTAGVRIVREPPPEINSGDRITLQEKE